MSYKKNRMKWIAISLLLVTAQGHAQKREYPFFDGTDEKTIALMAGARDQIEEVRKGDFTLVLTGENDQPISARAVIELESHDFDFGTNLFGFHKIPDSDPAKQTSMKAIREVFNTVTVCDYWSQNQKKPDGELNWGSPDYGYDLAEKLGKNSRHHALLFGFPRWFHHFKTEAEMWQVIEQRIRNVAVRYGDKITEVDVINEFINYQYWDHSPHAQYLKTTPYPDFAKPENGARVLRLARKYMPKAKLVVLEANLWNMPNPVFQEIYRYHQSLIRMGADYDYIGYQAHFYAQGLPFQDGTRKFGPRTFMMDEINRGIEHIGRLGKPIVITEFNPPSRSNKNKKPRQPRLSDEEIAAWETNFYTLMFSKPYIKEITRWFTIDNLGGRGMDAGVVDEKGQLKPNYYALKKLIREDWHTRWAGQVNDGQVDFRGFFGLYEVRVPGYQPRTIELRRSSSRNKKLKLNKTRS